MFVVVGRAGSLHTSKRDVCLDFPLSWEGAEIASKKSGFNLIMAKITLDFGGSTTPRGNIYLSGRGLQGRFHYLIGIDKSNRDVFIHIWDKYAKPTPRPSGVVSQIKERGRTHLIDYLKSSSKEKWLILGMEQGFDGPKFFTFREGEKHFTKIPVNPPPEIREELLKDSQDIFLKGISEFAIRTDLKVKDSSYMRSIKGLVDYVRVRPAPLAFAHSFKRTQLTMFI